MLCWDGRRSLEPILRCTAGRGMTTDRCIGALSVAKGVVVRFKQ